MIGIKMGVQTSEHNRRPADGNTNEVEPCKYNRSWRMTHTWVEMRRELRIPREKNLKLHRAFVSCVKKRICEVKYGQIFSRSKFVW